MLQPCRQETGRTKGPEPKDQVRRTRIKGSEPKDQNQKTRTKGPGPNNQNRRTRTRIEAVRLPGQTRTRLMLLWLIFSIISTTFLLTEPWSPRRPTPGFLGRPGESALWVPAFAITPADADSWSWDILSHFYSSLAFRSLTCLLSNIPRTLNVPGSVSVFRLVCLQFVDDLDS